MTLKKLKIILLLVFLVGIIILVYAPSLAIYQANAIEGTFELLFSRIILTYQILGGILTFIGGSGLAGLSIACLVMNGNTLPE